MSVSLPPERIMAVCKQRWQGHVLCWLAQIIAMGWFLQQRSARPHGPATPALLAASGLGLAFLALGDWLWRCPACKARLPRGMVALPRYCPLCAVPLSDPAEPPLVGSRPAKQVARGLMGFFVLFWLALTVLAPRGGHSVYGQGARRRVVVSQPTPAEAERLQRQIKVARDLLAGRWPGARLSGTPADLDLLQRLLDEGQPEPGQGYEIQCIGAAFGAVLANDAGLHWIMAEDARGREPALQSGRRSLVLFPVTTIARRLQRGAPLNLRRQLQVMEAMLRPPDPAAKPI